MRMLLLAALLQVGTGAAPKMNVLLLVADDMRPEIDGFGFDDEGIKAHTPFLDEFAKDALLLAANYVQQSVCGPTRKIYTYIIYIYICDRHG